MISVVPSAFVLDGHTNNQKETYIVFGGGGFLGRAIVDMLLDEKAGAEVRVFGILITLL